MYATIDDLYDIGITMLGFGCRKVSFGCQKVTLGHPKRNLWDDFGTWEGPRSGFIKVPHHFVVILEVIWAAQSDPESYKFEV